jgi:hypothetical protein
MTMKITILGAIAAVVAATSAHAQLASESTTGGSASGSATSWDSFFKLNNYDLLTVPGPPKMSFSEWYGGGTISFNLTQPAVLTFDTTAGTASTTGLLSGPIGVGGSAGSVPISYGLGTTTVDLTKTGLYTFFVSGVSLAMCSGLTVDINAVSAVPEARTYGMLLAGLAVIGLVSARRRRTLVARPAALLC